MKRAKRGVGITGYTLYMRTGVSHYGQGVLSGACAYRSGGGWGGNYEVWEGEGGG